MQKTGHKQSRLPSNLDSGIHDLLDALPYSAQLIDSNHKILAVNEILKQAVGMDEDHVPFLRVDVGLLSSQERRRPKGERKEENPGFS